VKVHAELLQGFLSKETPKAVPFVPACAAAAVAADVTVWKPDDHVNVIVSPTLRFAVVGAKAFALPAPTVTEKVADCPKAKQKIARTRKRSAVFAMVCLCENK